MGSARTGEDRASHSAGRADSAASRAASPPRSRPELPDWESPRFALTQPVAPGPEREPTTWRAAGPSSLCGHFPGSGLALPTSGRAGAAPAPARRPGPGPRSVPGFARDAREARGQERGRKEGGGARERREDRGMEGTGGRRRRGAGGGGREKEGMKEEGRWSEGEKQGQGGRRRREEEEEG